MHFCIEFDCMAQGVKFFFKDNFDIFLGYSKCISTGFSKHGRICLTDEHMLTDTKISSLTLLRSLGL